MIVKDNDAKDHSQMSKALIKKFVPRLPERMDSEDSGRNKLA